VSGSAADDYSGALSHIEYVAFINVSYVDPSTGEWRTESDVGLYGSESRLEDEWGVVVHVRAVDNRTDGCRPPVNPASDRWIALMRRGACKFHQKIHNAGIISNASAVVIYNSEEDTQLLTMKHKGGNKSVLLPFIEYRCRKMQARDVMQSESDGFHHFFLKSEIQWI